MNERTNISLEINLNSETGRLNSVILGIATDRGEKKYLNNPKYTEIVAQGKEPMEHELRKEIEGFNRILLDHDVEVHRPENLLDQNQMFCRDIGFAIGKEFFISKMKKENRRAEIKGIESQIRNFKSVHYFPDNAFIEGGDIVVWKDYVFVGIGDRTNNLGLKFLKEKIGDKKTVVGFNLKVTDNAKSNILHLDCTFQPVGMKYGLIYKAGFCDIPEPIYDIFGERNLIEVTQDEMYHMMPNIFSIDPETVVIDKSFGRLEVELKKRSIRSIGIEYRSVSKLGGLFRCVTCPINRDDL